MSGRREDHPVTEDALEDLQRWAGAADFPDPVGWGDVEARILTHLPPPRRELDPWYSKDERVSSAIGYLIMALVAVPTLGSPIIGLGLVVAYVQSGWSLPSDWFFLVVLLFIEVIVVPVIPVVYWWTARRREAWHFVLSGGAFAASLASVVLLVTSGAAGQWSQIALCALISAVLGLGAVVFLVVKAEPGLSRPWRERWRAITPEEKWYRAMRAGVLEQMAKRGLVDRIDVATMVSMPLGTWRELDDGTTVPWTEGDYPGV